MSHLVIIDEFNVLWVWFSAYFSKTHFYCLGISPHLFFLEPFLKNLVRRMVNCGLIKEAEAFLTRELSWDIVKGFRFSMEDTEAYNFIEDKAIEMFKMSPKYNMLGEYSYCYSKILSKYLTKIIHDIAKIDDLYVNIHFAKLVLSDPFLIEMYRLWKGELPYFHFEIPKRPYRILEAINVGAGVAFNLFFILSHITFKRAKREEYFLAVDTIKGQVPEDDHTYIAKQIAKNDKDLLFVFRNKDDKYTFGPKFRYLNTCSLDDGRVPISKGLSLIRLLLKDTHMIWRNIPNTHGLRAARFPTMIHEKLRLITFFEKYQIRAFWGRDDYRYSHILRTNIMRKLNSVSLGLQHGIPLPHTPSRKYVDYDIYYVFGIGICKYFEKTWSKQMTVKATGCWRIKKQHYSKTKTPRERNIIYFQVEYPYVDAQIREIIKLANHFSDRTVFIKTKRDKDFTSTSIENGKFRELENRTDLPDNVKVFYGSGRDSISAYDLMLRASYSITSLSSLAAESIQFGLVSFCFDLDQTIPNNYFRRFPGLCVKSAREIIECIKSIEVDRFRYNKEIYIPLINYTEEDIHNTIRKDIFNYSQG